MTNHNVKIQLHLFSHLSSEHLKSNAQDYKVLNMNLIKN